MSVAERKQVAATVREEAGDGFGVIVNISHMDYRCVLELADHAADIGVDAVSSLAPLYYPYDADEELGYYEMLLKKASLPLVLYNIPMKTKRILNESTVCHLAQDPKFVGIKHSSEDIALLSRFRQIAGGRLMVWSGRDAYYLGALAMGASGAIGSSYSLTGDVYMEITRAYRSGDVSRAMKLQNQINEVHRRLQVFGPYKSVKYCFSLMGIEAGNCRIPFKPIAPEAGEYLRETLVLLDRIRQ